MTACLGQVFACLPLLVAYSSFTYQIIVIHKIDLIGKSMSLAIFKSQVWTGDGEQ